MRGLQRAIAAPFRAGWTSRAPGSAQALGNWRRCQRGASAVEFALIAPMLALALVATADLGLGISDRISMAHVLRSGAQTAIEDPGTTEVTDVMRATASLNFTLDSGSDALTLSTERFCACPENTGVPVACSTICTGYKETFIYYRMSAQKTHTGWIMPSMTFDPSVQVQIR